MDESPQNTKPVPRPPDERERADLEQAYIQIGRTLLIAEAASTSIGIPWLPPTPRTVALRREFYEPLKDFVRQSLVSIPTVELEFYAEDLETLPPDAESGRRLRIDGLSAIERNMLTVLLFCACFALFFLLTLWVRGGLTLAISLSLIVASIVAAVSGYICSEASRRSTFHWLVFEELLRRKGLDKPGATPLPMSPIILQTASES